MKIKLLKDTPVSEKISICKGQVFNVRPLLKTSGLFGGIQKGYQILNDCQFQGEFLPLEYCLEVSDEMKFTKQEVRAIEKVQLEKLNKEREQKELAHQLVNELTKQINNKNKEIERLDFCVTVLGGSLQVMTEAFHKLKSLEKAK